MNAVTLKDAKRNLKELIDRIIADAEPTIVVTKGGGRVVIMPLDEYNSWKETGYLLANPANADHLRGSIAEARGEKLIEKMRGRATSGLSTDEIMALTRGE